MSRDPVPFRRLATWAWLLLAGCATARGGPAAPAGFPGFDTRDFPGADAMQVWRTSSPYRWVGYYLSDAPCYTGSTWTARREALEGMGWGLAVVFVGEQDWPVGPDETGTGSASDDLGTAPRCTRSNLTAERALADARQASATASGDGFPPGTVVYLDVEPVEVPSAALLTYVGTWAEALLDDGRYLPGLYAHASNAVALRRAMEDAFRARGRPEPLRLWVASAEGFSLESAPADAPIEGAWIWQGFFDAVETWGGISLRIDGNVSRSGSPSY